MPPSTTIALDVDALTSAYDARVAAACPEHAARAAGLLARLSADQWGIEWYLPAWLGDAFGLDPAVVRDLMVSNLLGLAAVRTFDDLADDAVSPVDRDAAQALADDLLTEALRPYRGWFAPGVRFWDRCDAWLAAWRETLAAPGADPVAQGADLAAPGADPVAQGADLAARGAPLKVAALAACLLAGCEASFAGLERCLDHGLQARVLYDHAVDWEDDLAAGRWNAFVAAASPLPQRPEHRAANRTTVLRAQVATDLIASYFARIAEAGEAAALEAERLGIHALADHDRTFALRAAAHGDRLRAQYWAFGQEAASLLFGRDTSLGMN